jgi:hypothetical protein
VMNSDILVHAMNSIVHNEKKAIELRRRGLSYTDIAKELKVSRTSVCLWVKNVKLTEVERLHLQKNIRAKMERGRMMASISLRSRKVFKEKIVYEQAEGEFEKKAKDPFFMLGIGLWGTPPHKKGYFSLQFTSANPEIMKIMASWVEKYLEIPKKAIKYRVYKSSTALIISRIKPIRQVIAWQKLTMRYYN